MPRQKKYPAATDIAKLDSYDHKSVQAVMRPEVGTQPQFKKKKPPVTYRYDSSLSPVLDWDGQNSTREQGEALIKEILETDDLKKAKVAASKLKSLGKPFLNWAGKAERLSFDVPTLPLFIHERLSTRAIIETLKGHKRDKQMDLNFFGDSGRPVTDQVLKAYEYQDDWVNRLVLGDSLVVMNSLLHYEDMGGKVQTIYMDPPYGVKFGSNFQPFVRKREVTHNDDDDMTREPEMVQAYRDTWELGLHSYLTYLRDRLFVARDLLTPSGSVFVQISDENLHHVREVMDEVFGKENFVSVIAFSKTTGFSGKTLSSVADYIIWYAKNIECVKYNQIFKTKEAGDEGATKYRPIETIEAVPKGIFDPTRLATSDQLTSQGESGHTNDQVFYFNNKSYKPSSGLHWKTTIEGLNRLAEKNRIIAEGNSIRYIRFIDDFPVFPISNIWTDIGGIQNRSEGKLYVVQTAALAIQRCLLMTTDPGDLVLDPTCGSGTTAYVAEQWGRRWITADTSRVPLALARQRLLTATFPYYELQDEKRGPIGGFVYKRKQNKKGEEVGGIVPHITLKSIANNEPPAEEVLVDRPEEVKKITRVTGPFCVEATIPTPVDWEESATQAASNNDAVISSSAEDSTYRLLEVLRKVPILRLAGNKTITLKNVRPPAKSLSLSAEALVINGEEKPVAFVFGPENGAISDKLVYAAAKEASAKSYKHLYVIGFAIQPTARECVEKCEELTGIPATYVQATPDLLMGDLLKNMRSSQIFSVCGLPEFHLTRAKADDGKETLHRAVLDGLDTFDPVTMANLHLKGDDVPAWFLDTDYNGLCFHVSQAFFPRTGAWDSLRKALKGTYEESVLEHLSGTVSAPFSAGEFGQVAIKVIDERGNELLKIASLKEART